MGYRSLRQCVDDLHSNGQLLVIDEPIHAQLEAAEAVWGTGSALLAVYPDGGDAPLTWAVLPFAA